VAERVPPDIAQTELSSSGTNVVLLDWTRVVTAAGDRAREAASEGGKGFQRNRRNPRSDSEDDGNASISCVSSTSIPSPS
jgi:hypothetical protein